MFEGKARILPRVKLLHSGRLWTYLQTLHKAWKTCQGHIL